MNDGNPQLTKRPVAFRVPSKGGGFAIFQDEGEAQMNAERRGVEYQGLYVRDGRQPPSDEVKAFVEWLDSINDKRTLGPWSHEPADGGLLMTETKENEPPVGACVADPTGDIICNAEYDNPGEEHDETAARREYDLTMIVALVNAWPMIRTALLANG